MNDRLHQALSDTLDYLLALVRDGTRPEGAQERLRPLQEMHPDTPVELLWEEEAYDRSVHYDALLSLPGQGTVSLSFCPESALPWPLRGARPVSERCLVKVNTILLEVDQAMACLDFIWDEVRILNRLVNACLIQEALARDPIALSDDELQHALSAFRRAHKLYTAEETYRWMERHGLTHEQLERLVADDATVAKLRDRVTAGRVEEYFQAHRADFDTARIARLHFPDAESASQAFRQICSGAVDFYEAAERLFRAAGERPSQSADGLFAVVQRRHASPELAAAVFAAAPGDLLGPVPTEEGPVVVRALSRTTARLDEPTRAAIKKILFEEWLEERRRAARIEWYWGNAARTGAAS
jgi:putative peptide maturation system protein